MARDNESEGPLQGWAREVAFLVYPGFQILDLTGPLAAFHIAASIAGGVSYRLEVISPTGGAIVSSCGLEVTTRSVGNAPYDTLIVVGVGPPGDPSNTNLALTPPVRKSISAARRKASVCTGAFILAAVGQLDGRRATTHWKYAAALKASFPQVAVDRDRIFIKDGDTWTSAGISAGIDLALAMIEEDLGIEVARATAQMLVVYHRRPGGQSQFSALLEMEPRSDRMRKVLSYVREHLTEKVTTERMAQIACLSPRQFGRAFLAETGETPAKAVERLRVELAMQRVKSGTEPIELIARNVGFADPERMRRAFIRVSGHPPQSIRRMAAVDDNRDRA